MLYSIPPVKNFSLVSKHTTDTASISVVVQPVPDSVLVQVSNKTKANSSTVTATTGALAFDYTRHDSLEAEIELRKSEPLPFSSKRSMFSTGKVAQVHMHNTCTVYTHVHVHVQMYMSVVLLDFKISANFVGIMCTYLEFCEREPFFYLYCVMILNAYRSSTDFLILT